MLTSDRYPYVEILIEIGTWSFIEHAYIDTGFEGGILIPAYLWHEILASYIDSPLQVADGEVVLAPNWNGAVQIANARFRVEIYAMGRRFLLGRDVSIS